ncbi:hypothetical protein PVAND_006476 [Polypedilum vanderplanki]|uniref:Uncharacterized protein n=1 Tax=Polypedilum vanderplanki TaxID=319348 RepID=A0A9J6C3R9_POLVA|nr:hypothetical protein PVAND_006476 [Polypedilum vanderplanki]
MASKFIALFALVAVASAQHYHNDYYQNYDNHHYAAPAAVIKQVQPAIIKQVQPALIKKVAYEHEAPANYEFNYDVHDTHTGDIKQQHEIAKEGAVSGEYSLIDADGYRRIVSYTADDHHGFIANVRREPVDGHHKIVAQPVVAKVVAPVVQKVAVAAPQYYSPAPVVQKYVAPVQKYVAPVQKYVAPVQKYVAAPTVHYSQPAVQYVQQPTVHKYVAPAPVVEKYVAPVVQKYVATPVVQKYVQPAQVVKHISGENSAHVSVSAPGDNFDISISSVRNCKTNVENQIVKLCENSSIQINDDCEIISNTCAIVKSYSRAFATLIVRNNYLVLMNISKEFCEKNNKQTDTIKIGMASTGIKCDGGKVNFINDHQRKVLKLSSAARKIFGLLNGDETHVQISIDHDTGKSCIEAELLFKQRKFS